MYIKICMYIYLYIIYIYLYIYLYFARRFLQLSQTFSPVTFHFSIKFTEIFYYSLMQTTSKKQCTRLGK